MQEVQISICELDITSICKQLKQLQEEAVVRILHIRIILVTLGLGVNTPHNNNYRLRMIYLDYFFVQTAATHLTYEPSDN
jgi:hypothetical protein